MCVGLLMLVGFHRESILLSSIGANVTNERSAHSVQVETTNERRGSSTTLSDINSGDKLLPENIEPSLKVPCGSLKCFYQLKSNPQAGYLVSPDAKRKRIKALQAGWVVANELKINYNISHFLLEPPISMNVSEALAKRLNRNLYIESIRKLKKHGQKANRFPTGSTISIQKVEVAPKKHLLIGCVPRKMRALRKDLPKFVSYVNDTKAFASSFTKGFDTALQILEDHPCLTKDFQVMVDTNGTVYHLDFDRCFKSSTQKFQLTKSETKSCSSRLDIVRRYIGRQLNS